MQITSIRLRNFRNHTNSSLRFGDGVNLLVGNNGEGKTNVVEAMAYLSLTKSFYAAGDSIVLKIGEERFDIDGTIVAASGRVHDIHVGYEGVSGEKTYSVNGVAVEALNTAIGRFPGVILSPEHTAVTSGAPAERRKFMDIILSQISRAYFEDLLEYRRCLKQRNKLLGDGRRQAGVDTEILEPWTTELVQYGSRVIQRRRAFVEEFQQYVRTAYCELVREEEIPEVQYVSVGGLAEVSASTDIAACMSKELERRAGEEHRRGLTLVGPHRDDLALSINGLGMQQYASQGQHKTFLVALKVAEFLYVQERVGEPPVFLLDDVFSELDEGRARRMLSLVPTLGQAIMTATNDGIVGSVIAWSNRNRKIIVERGICRAA